MGRSQTPGSEDFPKEATSRLGRKGVAVDRNGAWTGSAPVDRQQRAEPGVCKTPY